MTVRLMLVLVLVLVLVLPGRIFCGMIVKRTFVMTMRIFASVIIAGMLMRLMMRDAEQFVQSRITQKCRGAVTAE